MFWRILIFFLVIIVVEIYFLQAVKTFSKDFSELAKNLVLWTAYSLAIYNVLVGIASLLYPPPLWGAFLKFASAAGLILVICKLFGISFLIIDDIIRLFRWIFSLFSKSTQEGLNPSTEGISRIKFFSQLAIVFTIIPAISFIYGMVKGAYRFRVHKATVSSPNLPSAFDGFKIIQISDIHIGSFLDTTPIKNAFEIIAKQNGDLILFTGDLVNNMADETKPFLEELKKLQAPYGVYSVLGNHDYGDYIPWESSEAKKENFESLKNVHRESGWKLMLNEHVSIEKDGEKIALLGVENWGGSHHFPRYGKLDLAHKNTESFPFKILMSHDPSHWDKQIRKDYTDIDLTLSGHTHGMQFGIEIPGFKWSPVQYFYKQWSGLYKEGNQYLYVNRGLGFLGYPGRVGIWPEITVLELKKA